MDSISGQSFQICLEGNIGAGKSTLLNYFSSIKGIDVLPETLELWRTLPIPGTKDTHNLLDSFYKNPSEHTFAFQSYVMLTKVEQQLLASPNPVKILERGLHSVFHIFSRALEAEGYFPKLQYAVHTQWHRHFSDFHSQMMPDLFIWVKTDPKINFERIQTRGRAEESGITLEYLTLLSKLHDEWLTASPFAERTVIIDGNQSKAEVLKACKVIMHEQLPKEVKALLNLD